MKQIRVEEGYEEGQNPCWAVETTMMMVIHILNICDFRC